MWYYIQSEKNLWTVGCDARGQWHPDSDHDSREAAAERVAFLNGGGLLAEQRRQYILKRLREKFAAEPWWREVDDAFDAAWKVAHRSDP